MAVGIEEGLVVAFDFAFVEGDHYHNARKNMKINQRLKTKLHHLQVTRARHLFIFKHRPKILKSQKTPSEFPKISPSLPIEL